MKGKPHGPMVGIRPFRLFPSSENSPSLPHDSADGHLLGTTLLGRGVIHLAETAPGLRRQLGKECPGPVPIAIVVVVHEVPHHFPHRYGRGERRLADASTAGAVA